MALISPFKHETLGGCTMEIIEVKCTNCNKEIYIQNGYVREKNFCTLGCLKSYDVPQKKDFNWQSFLLISNSKCPNSFYELATTPDRAKVIQKYKYYWVENSWGI